MISASNKFRRPSLFWLVILVPPALIALIVAAYASEVPFMDEWDVAPLLFALRNGSLQFAHLWLNHNEHRMLFPRALIVSLMALLGKWSIRAEVFTTVMIAIAQLFIFWRIARATVPARFILPLTLIASALIFHPLGSYNWLMGLQIAWFLALTCAIAAIAAIFARPGRWHGVVIATVAAVIGTYSMSAGLAIWPVGLMGLIALRRKGLGSRKQIALWCVAGIGAIGVFLATYPTSTESSSLVANLMRPLQVAFFVVEFLGGPFRIIYDGSYSAIIGAIGVLLALALAIRLARSRRRIGLLPTAILPWVMIVFFSALVAGMIGVTRSHMENAAHVAHYVALSGLFWIGIAGAHMALSGLPTADGDTIQTTSVQPAHLAVAVITIALTIGYLRSWNQGLTHIQLLSGQLRAFELSMLSNVKPVPEDLVVNIIYPVYGRPIQYSAQLRKLDEGFFWHGRDEAAVLSRVISAATSSKPATRQILYQGYIGAVSCERIDGWAWDRNDPDPITVSVLVDGVPTGTLVANVYRADLVNAGIGDGSHGFSGNLPEHAWDGNEHTIALTFEQTNEMLIGSPRKIQCPAK